MTAAACHKPRSADVGLKLLIGYFYCWGDGCAFLCRVGGDRRIRTGSEVLIRRIRFRVLGLHIFSFADPSCRRAGCSCTPGELFLLELAVKEIRYYPLDAGKEKAAGARGGQNPLFALTLAAGYVVKALTETVL